MPGADQGTHCLEGLMSQQERYGSRDLTYSAWHRKDSTGRFVGIGLASTLTMIDVDCVECDRYNKPIALIETARDVGQPYKPATMTTELAMLSGLVAYLVLYTPSQRKNPAYPEYQDIDSFRVKRLWPEPEHFFTIYTPEEWTRRLVELRHWRASRDKTA